MKVVFHELSCHTNRHVMAFPYLESTLQWLQALYLSFFNFLCCFFNIAFCYLFCSANIGQFYFQLAKSGFNLRQCSPGWRWQWWVWTSWWSPWLSLGPSSTCRWSSICPTLDTVCTVWKSKVWEKSWKLPSSDFASH